MVKGKVKVGTVEVAIAASAATPLRYMNQFPGHDIILDMNLWSGEASDPATVAARVAALQQIVYVMAKDANAKTEADFEKWLEKFGVMDFYDPDVALTVLELWGQNNRTTAAPKKK